MYSSLFLIFLLIPFSFSLICQPGYSLVNGQKCLKLHLTPASHWDAESNCTASSGTLVNIKNAIDNRAILTLVSNQGIINTWIGLSCFGNSTSSCFWDNGSGSPVAYNNFMKPYPSEVYGRCVVMGLVGSNQGKWTSANCGNNDDGSMRFPYICEVPATVDNMFMPCVNNYNGYCYYKSEQIIGKANKIVNSTEAKSICARVSVTNLASIHSKMEIDFIRNLYKGTNTSSVYVGAEADVGGRFSWIDGTNWDFDYSDPLNFQTGKCLIMDFQGNGLWSQVDCSQRFDFLCKRKISSIFTEIPEVKEVKASDSSNCNSTLYLAPGSISSFGFPITPPSSYCSWRLVALGPYRLGIFFDLWATYGKLTIYDEFGTNIGEFVGSYNRSPFSRYTPFNVATVNFEPREKTGEAVDRGFHAVVLPI